jgi:hypothetical protein
MSDYTLPPASRIICGMTGSGKTTAAFRYLEKADPVCRFIFDDMGQAHARMDRPLAATATEMEESLGSRWILYNPHRMFPGEIEKAFDFFCEWVLDACSRVPGRKIVLIDEVWRFTTPYTVPKPLAKLAQMGRAEGVELVTCTQRPNRLNESIRDSATEIVCFKLTGANQIECMEETKAKREEIMSLPLGKYLSFNRLNGQMSSGKVF